MEAAARAPCDGRTGYPDNQGEPACAGPSRRSFSASRALNYDPDREILVTDGATLGICTALVAPRTGVSVLLPDPI